MGAQLKQDPHLIPNAHRGRCIMKPPSVPLTDAASPRASGYIPAAQEEVDRFDFSVLASVRPTIVPHHTLRCPRTSDCLLLLHHHWPCSTCRQNSERLCGTPCRTAHRSESQAISSLCRATLSVTSERFPELLGSSPIPLSSSLLAFCFQLRSLPSPGITRLPRYYGPPRHPTRPGLALASCQLIPNCRSPLGLPVLRLVHVSMHAVATTPAGLM